MIPTELSTLSQLNPGVVIAVMIWSIIWKGLALWRSAQRNEKIWFVALLIVNTLGLLEILYLFVFSKMSLPKSAKRKKKE